jgi:hypothetical protein
MPRKIIAKRQKLELTAKPNQRSKAVLSRAKSELVERAMDKIIDNVAVSKDADTISNPPKRKLGILKGKMHLSIEDALAPLDEGELGGWGGQEAG